jgi:hypothetical protein
MQCSSILECDAVEWDAVECDAPPASCDAVALERETRPCCTRFKRSDSPPHGHLLVSPRCALASPVCRHAREVR